MWYAYIMKFSLVEKENENFRKANRPGKYNINQSNPISERENPSILFHMQILAKHIHTHIFKWVSMWVKPKTLEMRPRRLKADMKKELGTGRRLQGT